MRATRVDEAMLVVEDEQQISERLVPKMDDKLTIL